MAPRTRYPRARQEAASSNLRRKAPSQSSSSRSSASSSSSNIAARSPANKRDGPPFMPVAPEPPTCDAAAPQRATIKLSEEQMQRLIRELSNIQSNRSSGESGSSTNDYTEVPHISSIYGVISQIMMSMERLKHNVCILSERVLQQDEAKVGRIFEEINQLKAKVECFKDKIEWATFQMRSNESQTKNAQTSFDFWSASLARLTSMLEQHLASARAQPAPPQPFGSDYSHVHLRMPPPPHSHHYRPLAPGRHAGSSSRPSIICSSDEE